MSLRKCFLFFIAAVLLSACAADRVVEPAKAVAKVVSGMQADLSQFDTQVKSLQAGEAELTSGNNLVRDLALTWTMQTQATWELAQSANTTQAFKLLQDRCNAEVAALLAGPIQTTGATSALVPLDKIGSVSSALNQLSKTAGARAGLDSLVQFGTQVNQDLSTAKTASTGGANQ
ncbi:MAG TPA: hypothetical protein VGS41_11655 [Chthonomonadales bacterium]|nr:hypothetical protein [Chthonomonadales bacterium]